LLLTAIQINTLLIFKVSPTGVEQIYRPRKAWTFVSESIIMLSVDFEEV
jgi:hypothetical protein